MRRIVLAQEKLRVERFGEDPVRGRAWLAGRREDGTGLLCVWPGELPAALARGALVRATGRLNVPRPPTNPGESDRAGALARAGIRAKLYLGNPGNLEFLEPAGCGFFGRFVRSVGRSVRRFRRRGAQRLAQALPHADAGLATALLFGWRSGITERDRLRFERAGTLHLLAISGLHLMLVAGAVGALARRLGLGPRAAAACTLCVCLLYVPIAGAGAPVRRAAAVLVVYGVAMARGRVPDAASALGGAALLVVLQDAEEVRRIGFWLSFLAAAGIATYAGRWHRVWSARHRLLARFPAVRKDRAVRLRVEGYLLSALPVSIAAWCATAPLVAWQFGIVTPVAPLTNLVVAPFVTLLMPVQFAVSCGVDALVPVSTALCAAMRGVLDAFDTLPGASTAVAPPAVVALVLWYVGFVTLRWSGRAGIIVMGGALLLAWPEPDPRKPRMIVLDVGHGQAVLLIDRHGRAALIDGGSRSRLNIGRRVLRPALRALGVARLDCVVCTHADADHWNGLVELVGRIPIETLHVGTDPPASLVGFARERGTVVIEARADQTLWDADGISARVVDDGRRNASASANDRSLVLLVEIGQRRILLPADREVDGTRALLRQFLQQGLPSCDAMLAPHHGGANDAAGELGERVRPTWLLVSTSPGFADESTLRRYGAERVLRTDVCGALTVEATGDVRVALGRGGR